MDLHLRSAKVSLKDRSFEMKFFAPWDFVTMTFARMSREFPSGFRNEVKVSDISFSSHLEYLVVLRNSFILKLNVHDSKFYLFLFL